MGSPNAQTFTFTDGASARSGDLEVYINSTGAGRLELGRCNWCTAVQLPEPSSIVALLGLCGMGLILWAKRREEG